MTAPVGTWENADGLKVKFGQYWANAANFTNITRSVNTLGSVRQLEFDFDLTRVTAGTPSYTTDLNNDGTVDGFSDGDVYLPPNAAVKDVMVVTKVGAAGGTSFTLGTYQQNGTAISANSLITATEGVIANITSAGQKLYGAGALTSNTAGTAGVGTGQAFIALNVTGTFTAGTGRVIITYIDPNAG